MNHIPLLCDNESVIKIAYNPCEYSRTKHIDIRTTSWETMPYKGILLFHMLEQTIN
jgi:hypothetical protein